MKHDDRRIKNHNKAGGTLKPLCLIGAFNPGTPLRTVFSGFGEDKPFKVCSVDVSVSRRNAPLNFVDHFNVQKWIFCLRALKKSTVVQGNSKHPRHEIIHQISLQCINLFKKPLKVSGKKDSKVRSPVHSGILLTKRSYALGVGLSGGFSREKNFFFFLLIDVTG